MCATRRVLQDELSRVRREANAAAAELLEPGIDGLVAKLQEAEALNGSLRRELRAGDGGDAAVNPKAAARLRAEVEHVKALNGNLRAENMALKSDVHVCLPSTGPHGAAQLRVHEGLRPWLRPWRWMRACVNIPPW